MVVTTDIRVDTDVPARMRDGVLLRADVYRPAVHGTYPVLLTRTPYSKSSTPQTIETARTLASHGYIVAVQDVRGRFTSEGVFRGNPDDIPDGHDSVVWAAGLEGSTGAVGMYGGSYMGITSLLAAAHQPPQLKAIFPVFASPNLMSRSYINGAYRLADRLSWAINNGVETADKHGLEAPDLRQIAAVMRRRQAVAAAGDPEEEARARREATDALRPLVRYLPINGLPVLKDVAPQYFEALEHPTYDAFWHEFEVQRFFPKLDLLCLSVGGWYDLMLDGNLNVFTGLSAYARTPESRRGQRLLIGPWTHGTTRTQVAGDTDFGPEAALDLLPLQVRWFDHWLKGSDTGLLDEPPVRIFVMGSNRWRDEWEWPLARTRYTPYYLHSNGSANTLHGDGILSVERPGTEPSDSFVYDPDNPVPTVGGNLLPSGWAPGPFDQREVEGRPDVLCYTTPPLAQDLEVTGPIGVTLYAASNAPDTDWTAKLVDVSPDGPARNIQDGIVRASHRIPSATPTPIRPGAVYEYTVDLWATSNVFLAGHRLRLEISSSNFPHYDRNTNTGLPFRSADRVEVARQTVFHDAGRPSHIMLPVISSWEARS